jgi:proline iminopeptidase
MQYLSSNNVTLPSGVLTPARFQQLGILFGFHGGLDSLHGKRCLPVTGLQQS